MSVSRKSVTEDISRIRKLQNESLSPSKKIKIVERYKMAGYDTQPHQTSHLDLISAMRRVRELERDKQDIDEKLEALNKHIMIFKTSISNRELTNCKLEDDIIKLDQELKHSRDDLEKLQEFQADSLKSLQKMFDLRKKELGLLHEEKLMRLKEQSSDIIMAAIEQAKKDAVSKRQLLEKDIDGINASIKVQQSDMNRALIKLKETNHKKLLELHRNMDDIISGLERDSHDIKNDISLKESESEVLVKCSIPDLESMISDSEQELAELVKTFTSEESQVNLLKAEVSRTQKQLQDMKSSCTSKFQIIEDHRTEAANLQTTFPLLEERRRLLHDKLQELKGNIRVFCRVRPVQGNEHERILLSTDPDGNLNDKGKEVLQILTEHQPNESVQFSRMNLKSTVHEYQFDKLFGEEKKNHDIFSEISQLVQSSLDGFNVCVFAYGQTGSGKTWTMSHKDDGMIPLSFRKIFEDISNLHSQGWEYKVEGQFVEIYNDQIFDLLSTSTETLKCEIKHDDELQRTIVTNATVVKMTSAQEALEKLNFAIKRRSTASTMANERSSRSHLVFMLRITGTHLILGKVSAGTLNLIDLAGSERLRNSQAKGERLKETQAINKSLSSLGDVISGLARQTTQHIPYRNSKLTYLLRHSLGGRSKTLMFVNISPLKANLSETINSLRFATKVNATKLH